MSNHFLHNYIPIQKVNFEYQPGDAIGVYCSNDSEEVDLLLRKLNIYDRADIPCEVKVKEELATLSSGTKSKYDIPGHIPKLATLRFIFTHCCEIRSVPRKVMAIQIAYSFSILTQFLTKFNLV